MVYLVLCGLAASGQDLTRLKQEAEQRATEWNTLAENLEQRVARLLPCDPRMESSIQEVSRASEARLTALAKYWTAAADRVHQQAPGIRLLAAQAEFRSIESAKDHADADEQNELVSQRQTALSKAVLDKAPAYRDAQHALETLDAPLKQDEVQAERRDAAVKTLAQSLRDIISANQALKNALAGKTKALNAEVTEWEQYYAARLSRAQTECASTKGPPAPAPRRTPAKKRP